MAEDNIELFRTGLAAYNARDAEAMVALMHPDVEWHPAVLVQLTGAATVFRGHEGIRELFRQVDEAFSSLHVETDQIRDFGTYAIALGRYLIRGMESDAEVEGPAAWRFDVEDGKVIRVTTTVDRQEIAEIAAELRESG